MAGDQLAADPHVVELGRIHPHRERQPEDLDEDTASHGLNFDIKAPPARPMLPPAKPGGKPRKGKRVFTPMRPLYKVENAFARLGMWWRLSRCYEQTALGAQTWLEVACVACLCGWLRVEPT